MWLFNSYNYFIYSSLRRSVVYNISVKIRIPNFKIWSPQIVLRLRAHFSNFYLDGEDNPVVSRLHHVQALADHLL